MAKKCRKLLKKLTVVPTAADGTIAENIFSPTMSNDDDIYALFSKATSFRFPATLDIELEQSAECIYAGSPEVLIHTRRTHRLIWFFSV